VQDANRLLKESAQLRKMMRQAKEFDPSMRG
jgi:hypothetical protein